MSSPPPRHREGVPRFVAVYDQVRDLIAARGLQPGDLLPGEDSLAADLGVSRAVVREALLLLDEDGYVARDALRRRVVASRLHQPVGFTDSFHRMLGADLVPLHRLHASVEETSSFTEEQLAGTGPVLVWETLFGRGEERLAATLEFMRVDRLPTGLADDRDLDDHDVAGQPTLLEALGPERRARLRPLRWRLAPVSRNTERLAWMDLALHAIPVVLTVLLAEDGVPVYLAKNLFDLDADNLVVDLTGVDP